MTGKQFTTTLQGDNEEAPARTSMFIAAASKEVTGLHMK